MLGFGGDGCWGGVWGSGVGGGRREEKEGRGEKGWGMRCWVRGVGGEGLGWRGGGRGRFLFRRVRGGRGERVGWGDRFGETGLGTGLGTGLVKGVERGGGKGGKGGWKGR